MRRNPRRMSREKTAVQRQIDATDKQIDQLVYEFYGLSDEEIKMVEKDGALLANGFTPLPHPPRCRTERQGRISIEDAFSKGHYGVKGISEVPLMVALAASPSYALNADVTSNPLSSDRMKELVCR